MSFRANCFKCNKNYNSNDPNDEDGADFCPKCRRESKLIAREVDKKIKASRKNRKPPVPKMKPFQVSSDGRLEIYNARQLLLNE